jgi:hypothetical protein
MRDTIEMAREAGFMPAHDKRVERLVALVRADERNASINAVLRVIKELYPALVLAAFSNRDNAWVLNKVKESIEKLKEKN